MNRQVVRRTQPENLNPEHKEIFARSALFEMRHPSVSRLSNVFVFWQGQVFEQGKIFPESIATELFMNKYGKLFFLRGLVSAWLRRKIVRMETPCLIVHDEWSMNYFHWMTDALSRLYMVKDMLGGLTLILPESYNSDFHTDVLNKMGVSRIRYTNDSMLIFSQSLVLPNHTAPAGNYNPEILRNAIRHLQAESDCIEICKADKIYISRSRASVRKVLNESEVQDCLVKLGFQVLYMEDYTLTQAMSIMRAARILVSIHGAALANLMFMKPGSCILELRKEVISDVYNSYFTLASAFGLHYYYLTCRPDDIEATEQYANIWVDTFQLEETCRLMMERIFP